MKTLCCLSSCSLNSLTVPWFCNYSASTCSSIFWQELHPHRVCSRICCANSHCPKQGLAASTAEYLRALKHTDLTWIMANTMQFISLGYWFITTLHILGVSAAHERCDKSINWKYTVHRVGHYSYNSRCRISLTLKTQTLLVKPRVVHIYIYIYIYIYI
jgi:hypothetical protein